MPGAGREHLGQEIVVPGLLDRHLVGARVIRHGQRVKDPNYSAHWLMSILGAVPLLVAYKMLVR